MSEGGPRNSSRQRARCSLSLSVALSTIQVTVLGSTPIFRENPIGERQGSPTSLLTSTTREDLRLDGYLEYHHAAKALWIYKHACLPRDSNQALRYSSQLR
ncbi:hypothetical protein TNCV_1861001 [Trichonephila clavipes]|nr:hypothetical protein TNCV_1861001 [Trichonephila clavipes]